MLRIGFCRRVVNVSCILLGASCAFAEEPLKENSTLSQVRRVMPESFTLDVEIDLPVVLLMPGQGQTTRTMRVTVGEDVTAIVWKALQLPVPKYYPPDTGGYQGGDYDADGNLIVHMWSEGATLRDQGVNEEYSESMGFRAAPDGTVAGKTSGASLSRLRPSASNTISLNLLRRILWALGRPWPDSFGREILGDLSADQPKRLRAAGSWSPGSGFGAVCELVIEPSNGYLVRQASFGAEGQSPRAECRSEGIRRFGDVVLAARGEFTLHPVETINVRLISFSPKMDPNLIAEARKVIARAQTRMVRVFDYREDPTRAKVRMVPAGDLDDE